MPKWFQSLAIATLAVFAPIKAALATVLVLIIFDLASGISAAIKRKEKIKSSGLRRTIVKAVVYESCLALGYIAETYLLYGAIPIVKILAGIIATTELLSILENCNCILGKSVFKILIDKLGSESKKSSDDATS